MRNEILEFAIKMDNIMNIHENKKGDSWKFCDLKFLEDKLDKEYNEWIESKNENELIDIANICMMLFFRKNKE